MIGIVSSTAQASDAVYHDFFKNSALPLTTSAHLSPLYDAIGERRFVLLGESTHGTHEYYYWRAKVSRELISEHNFSFVAIEGDWQAVYRLNDFVKLRDSSASNARELLLNSTMRWPRWMWINEEFADFLDWLRSHNAERPMSERVGVFGLDMQDPQDSMSHVLSWFQNHDTNNHSIVKDAYQRLFNFPGELRGYAQYLANGGARLDEQAALPAAILRAQLSEQGSEVDKSLWITYENARVVQRAEKQFHAATQPGPESWNQRARFMHEVLLRIAQQHGSQSRGIVWAHNTHVGDSTATNAAGRGEVNLGHLLRTSEDKNNVYILGFGTHSGSVVASTNWEGKEQIMEIIPAHPESYEGLLHKTGIQQGLWLFDDTARNNKHLTPRYQRAIGVIYRPPNEAYVPTLLTQRYDAFIYFETTQALRPLEVN